MAKQFLIIIICLILGGLIGSLISILVFKQTTVTPQDDNTIKLAAALSSQTIMVSSAIATGKITNISGRTITIIAAQGQSLDIPIRDDAQISSIVPSAKAGYAPTVKTIDFNGLKKGDNVYINLELLSDGGFRGLSVTVALNS